MAIDGLVSGLDTTSIINSLMQVEAVPQTLLKNKVSATQSMITALQGLNSKIADLATLAGNTAKPGALDLYTATSTSPSLTVATTSGASAGSIDVVVDRLAQSQVSLSAPMTSWVDGDLTITGTDNVAHTVTATASLDDMVSAINAAGAGVSAIKVASGTDPGTGATQYRLQITSTKSGADGAFTLSDTSFTEFKAAQDAQVTLWGNTAITSATNTFTDLLPGVSVTVSAASVDPITVSVARDEAKISSTAKSLIDSVNGVLAYISTKTAVTTSTDANGAAKVSGGVFTGDSTVRDVEQRIVDAASAPVSSGKSPSEFGISITRDGTMEFDATKFAAALTADPAATQSAVQEIASRIQVAAAAASDKYDGQITTQITGQQGLVTDMNKQIDGWDDRLATRRATLERTYSALEVQLSQMKSQSNWLTSQLAGLPTSGA